MSCRLRLAIMLALTVLGLAASGAGAEPGVGVNLGRIEIEDSLSPGGAYDLPVLGVINSGSEAGDYEVVISYVEGQEEMRPSQDWFEIEPSRFALAQSETQNVSIRLALPTSADPGDYFAFIEAHPVAEEEGVTIGIAAATRLSFTVEPSSWLDAQRVRIERFLEENQPWTFVVPAVVLGVLLFLFAGRNFRFRMERR